MSFALYQFRGKKIDVMAIPAMKDNAHTGWRVMVDGKRYFIGGTCSKISAEREAFKLWRNATIRG